MTVRELAPLALHLSASWGVPVQICAATRLSGGASRSTWALDLAVGDAPAEAYVLQQQRAGDDTASCFEADLLVAAARGGVPVPELVAADAAGTVLGTPFLLTRRVEGETLPGRLRRDPAYASARELFAGQCGEVLAAVHALPLEAVGELTAVDQLADLRLRLDQAREPQPVLELALAWLEDTDDRSDRQVVVHGDFRAGNLIVGPEGLRAVLDWELAHVGDPLEDLGWLCGKAWRFGGALPVGGMGTREQLLTSYAAASGCEVDPAALFWWEVLGTVKWGVICVRQAAYHLDGDARSVELAVIGRRLAEVELDLLRMLP